MPVTRAPSVVHGEEGVAAAPATGLDDLVLALAEVDSCLAREVVAGTVHLLERWAGSPLGSTDRDPVVVLQRRAARARRLLRRDGTVVPAAELAAAGRDLRDPAGALQRLAGGPSAARG